MNTTNKPHYTNCINYIFTYVPKNVTSYWKQSRSDISSSVLNCNNRASNYLEKRDLDDVKILTPFPRTRSSIVSLTDATLWRKIHQCEILSYIEATTIIRHSYRAIWFMVPLYENGSACWYPRDVIIVK